VQKAKPPKRARKKKDAAAEEPYPSFAAPSPEQARRGVRYAGAQRGSAASARLEETAGA